MLYLKQISKNIKETYFSNKGLLALLSLAVILSGAFTLLFSSRAMSDCMGYYHLAIAKIYLHQGIIQQFPQIPFSEFAEHYVDQHFLYNFLLIPFAAFFEDAHTAMSLATMTWITLLGLLLIWFFKSFKLPYTNIFVLLLFISTTVFSIRLLMPRPMVASVFMLLAFHGALYKRSVVWLFVTSFIYGWLYHASVQVLASVGLYVVLVYFIEHQKRDRLFLAAISGFVLSLLINPHTPYSLSFFIRHTFYMSHANMGVALPAEWLGMSLAQLVQQTALVLLLTFSFLLPYIIKRKKPSTEALHLMLLALLYFVASLKAIRFLEYFGLFPILASAFLLRDMPKISWMQKPVTAVLLVIAVLVGSLTVLPELRDFHKNAPFDDERMLGAATYLNEHAKKGSVIFNAYSGDFPELLYHAGDFGYTEGHNHVLMAFHDPKRYKEFIGIVRDPKNHLASKLKNFFNARFVVFSKKSAGLVPKLFEAIKNKRGLRLVYQDDYALVAETILLPPTLESPALESPALEAPTKSKNN